jgi:hypothetical protein
LNVNVAGIFLKDNHFAGNSENLRSILQISLPCMKNIIFAQLKFKNHDNDG